MRTIFDKTGDWGQLLAEFAQAAPAAVKVLLAAERQLDIRHVSVNSNQRRSSLRWPRAYAALEG
jgi:hypothetical protein